MMTGKQTLQFRARDGFVLHGDLFEPEGEPRGALLIAPAMAVHRGYYEAFASDLARQGMLTLVPDYRGIGDSRPRSLRGMPARLRDWAELDLEGALDELATRRPGLALHFLGHSIGGQLFGLLDASRVRRALLVAAQSGYHGHWPWPDRARMLALWYVVVPALSHALGYLPIGRITGGGEDVPKQVALDWNRWCRHREYMFGEGPLCAHNAFAHFDGTLRAYAITDDELAPFGGVAWLCDRYQLAQRELVRLRPEEVGVPRIGHFAAFRPKFRDSVWPRFRDFLLS